MKKRETEERELNRHFSYDKSELPHGEKGRREVLTLAKDRD